MRTRPDDPAPRSDGLLAPVRTQLPELRRLFCEVRTAELLNRPDARDLRQQLVEGLAGSLELFTDPQARRAATSALPAALGIRTDLFCRLLGLPLPAPVIEEEEEEAPEELSPEVVAAIRANIEDWRERFSWIRSAESDLGARIAAVTQLDPSGGVEHYRAVYSYVGRLLGLSGNCLSSILLSRHNP